MSRTADFSNFLLETAFDRTASDIHFVPRYKKTDIYFRVNGSRILIQSIPIQLYRSLLAHFKFLSGMDIGENRQPQSAAICDNENHYDLRLSTLPVAETESLAIRILPHKSIYSLDNSYLVPFQVKNLLRYIDHKSGLFLISGPTGSGKSSALYNLIRFLIEKYRYQTVTIEDPIEQVIDQTIQIQVNHINNLTFSSGLRASLRHDPDVIMIGEIRDAKTAISAFEAALTGHLVLSTIHAKNAVGTIQRLLEMGISQTDLRQSLLGIASTKLIPINYKSLKRRAVILEMLIQDQLEKAIKKNGFNTPDILTFNDLQNKAYAYGFISKNHA